MELTREEEAALAGEHGEVMETAYRVLVATGEAAGAERLVDVEWAHLSGVNYNTIGEAGEQFLATFSQDARVRIRASLNPMGYDIDSVSRYDLDDDFISKQESIRRSYQRMGVTPTFSCIPYEILKTPKKGTQVALAESNAAIYANSVDGLHTDRESAFSALASAITGKSPYSALREDHEPDTAIRTDIAQPDDLEFGLLGYFAGKVADQSVAILGAAPHDQRNRKALCGGIGTSGTCGRFTTECSKDAEMVDFGREELCTARDELNTADDGDIITLGSPQLGLEEVADLSSRLSNRRFKKRCMVFCPRAVQEQIKQYGYKEQLEHAGCEVLHDSCVCLTPLINPDEVDSVITNSVKGAYYLNKSTGVNVNLKPLAEIIRDETR